MYREPTFSERARSTRHRSFFRERLQRLAGERSLTDWLVEEANVRGYFGAMGVEVPQRPPTPGLRDEALVAALLMPHAVLDVRLFKLVIRLLQRGTVDKERLWLEARKERADSTLYWLLQQVPAAERTPELLRVLPSAPPRGYRPLPIDYDGRRLLRRAATKASTWKAARRSS
jgi:hypothetical protein